MKITITQSKPHHWYNDAIDQEFDADLRFHHIFKYYEYILSDTDRNREYFKNDNLSLMALKAGNMGVEFSHAVADQEFESDMYEQDRKAREGLIGCDEHFNMWFDVMLQKMKQRRCE